MGHIVLDLVYTPDEGQECFGGTHDECQEFIKEQGGYSGMYKIVPSDHDLPYYNTMNQVSDEKIDDLINRLKSLTKNE